MEGISKYTIHCHGLKCLDEVIVGVQSTGEGGVSGGGVAMEILVVVGRGGGEGVEGLKDKVFDLWAV